MEEEVDADGVGGRGDEEGVAPPNILACKAATPPPPAPLPPPTPRVCTEGEEEGFLHNETE